MLDRLRNLRLSWQEHLGEEGRFLLKHSLIYGIGTVLGQVVSFLLLPVYTRYLTPEDYGVLELVGITTGILGIIVSAGVAAAVSRFYYDSLEEKEQNCVVSTAYYIVIAFSTVSGLIFSIAARPVALYILDSETYGYYFLLSFGSLISTVIGSVGLIYLRIIHRSFLFLIFSLSSMILTISLNIFFVVFLRYGVLGILYGNLIANAFSFGPLTLFILRRVGVRFKWDVARELLKFSLPLIPSQLASTVVNYSDRYFIKHFVSVSDAGIYSLGTRFGTATHTLITHPFIMVFNPRRFQIAHRPNAKETFERVFRYYILAVLIVGLAISIFIDEIMTVMTTEEFYRAGDIVPVILLAMLFLGMKYHFEFGILQSKKTVYYSYINVTTGCLNLLLNWTLIRYFGIWGAAWSCVTSVGLNTLLVYFVGNRFYRIHFDLGFVAKALLFSAGVLFISRYPVSDSIVVSLLYKLTLMIVCVLVATKYKLFSRKTA